MQSCVYGEPKDNYQCMQGAFFFINMDQFNPRMDKFSRR